MLDRKTAYRVVLSSAHSWPAAKWRTLVWVKPRPLACPTAHYKLTRSGVCVWAWRVTPLTPHPSILVFSSKTGQTAGLDVCLICFTHCCPRLTDLKYQKFIIELNWKLWELLIMKIKLFQHLFLQYFKTNYYCYSCQFANFAPNKEINDMK